MPPGQREPHPERVKQLYEDLLAISAAGDGVLVPHLRRLMNAAQTNRPALDRAVRRWRSDRRATTDQA